MENIEKNDFHVQSSTDRFVWNPEVESGTYLNAYQLAKEASRKGQFVRVFRADMKKTLITFKNEQIVYPPHLKDA